MSAFLVCFCDAVDENYSFSLLSCLWLSQIKELIKDSETMGCLHMSLYVCIPQPKCRPENQVC